MLRTMDQDAINQEKLKEEKKRLENILNNLCRKRESERNSEVMKLLHEYNGVKDAVQVFHYYLLFAN